MSVGDLHEVEPQRRAGVALDEISAQRRQWQRQHKRPAALSAREALAALKFEALLVWVAAGNLAAGLELTEADRERLGIAARRIEYIFDEAGA
jgi:hypothetical protein